MRILLLLFSCALFGFSADDWWIYTYEDVSTLKSVFNYLAMIRNDTEYLSIVEVLVIAGTTIALVQKTFEMKTVPLYFISTTGLLLIILGSTVSVNIQNVKMYDSLNPISGSHVYARVDNVPYLFGVLASAFSNMGYHSARLAEAGFSSISSNEEVMKVSFLTAGYNGMSKISSLLQKFDIRNTSSEGAALYEAYTTYLQKCVFDYAIPLQPTTTPEALRNTSDVFAFTDPAGAEPFTTIASLEVLTSTGMTTCANLYALAKTQKDALEASSAIMDAIEIRVGKTSAKYVDATASVVKSLTATNIADAEGAIKSYILKSSMFNVLDQSWQSYAAGKSLSSEVVGAYGAGLSQSQYQVQGKTKAKTASTLIPSLHSVLQALMYVLFPFVLGVQLVAGGFLILKNYIMGLIWIELWVPSFSVLQYFTIKEAQTKATDELIASTQFAETFSGESLLTISNQNEIYNIIANQAAAAADMFWMVPFISGFILYASFHSLMGLTSGMAGLASQSANTDSQTQAIAQTAALENAREQIADGNPLYTGNIGDVAMLQSGVTANNATSAAVGRFLGANSGAMQGGSGGGSPFSKGSSNLATLDKSLSEKRTMGEATLDNRTTKQNFMDDGVAKASTMAATSAKVNVAGGADAFESQTVQSGIREQYAAIAKNDAVAKHGVDNYYDKEFSEIQNSMVNAAEIKEKIGFDEASKINAEKSVVDLKNNEALLNQLNKDEDYSVTAERIAKGVAKQNVAEGLATATQVSEKTPEELYKNYLAKKLMSYGATEGSIQAAEKSSMTFEQFAQYNNNIKEQVAHGDYKSLKMYADNYTNGNFIEAGKAMGLASRTFSIDGKKIEATLDKDGNPIMTKYTHGGPDGVVTQTRGANNELLQQNIDGSIIKNTQTLETSGHKSVYAFGGSGQADRTRYESLIKQFPHASEKQIHQMAVNLDRYTEEDTKNMIAKYGASAATYADDLVAGVESILDGGKKALGIKGNLTWSDMNPFKKTTDFYIKTWTPPQEKGIDWQSVNNSANNAKENRGKFLDSIFSSP